MSLGLAGAWLWETFGGMVMERAGQRGGAAIRALWQRINWQQAAEQYRGEMQRLYNHMHIIGMTEAVALADVFTDVYILDQPSAWRRHNIEELMRLHRLEQAEHDKAVVRRDAVEVVRRSERLFLLGKPGAGKTTLLKHLVLCATGGEIDAVPIFVGLKAWSDSGLALMPFLVRQFAICAFPDAQPFIEQILTAGRALVLFDGLDEVNLESQARERIIREVRDFADQYARNRIVITCRTAATDYQFEQFSYGELADFTEAQARTFVGNWFIRDPAKGDAFLVEFAKPEHDRLRDLARTPLLLALLCIAFDETMHFPARRVEVYEEALDALLKKWDSSRRIHRDELYKRLSLGRKRELLSQLAYESFLAGKLFLPQQALARQIEAYLRDLPRSDSEGDIDGSVILRAIEAQHGLLIERARAIYAFSHLTFQEYFAARHIVAHPSPAMFRTVTAHACDPRWREVLLLVASMLDNKNTQAFFDAFTAELYRLLEADPTVQALIRWVVRKAERVVAREQLVARMDYITLVLVSAIGTNALGAASATAFTLARTLTLAHTPDHIREPARAFARSLDHAPTYARVLALVFALARVLARVSPHSQPKKGKPSQDEMTWTGVLLWIRVIAASGPGKRGLDDATHAWHSALADAPSVLRDALGRLTLPAPDAPSKLWQHLAHDLRRILQTHLDIAYEWELGKAQLNLLDNYLVASGRLLECLGVAAVSDRDAIRNRLLLPRPAPDRRRPPKGRVRR